MSARVTFGETIPFSEARWRSSLFAIDLSDCEAEESAEPDAASSGGRDTATGVDRGGRGGGTGRGGACGGELVLDVGSTVMSLSRSPELVSVF